tara:strand:+ start:130 stop:1044 length:915 start_codon:yes stop_codon:yes gene_type:complete
MTTNLRTIVSVSGGKDSVAACLHLREMGIEHERVFMDTGWEHPDLYAHLDYLEGVLGPITRVRPRMPDLPPEIMPEILAIEEIVGSSPSGFVRWAAQKAFFPSRRKRWCTEFLKIQPMLTWVDELDEDILNVVGIRAEESARRAAMPERELMPGQEHIEVWRPLLNWTEAQVIAIHQRHGVKPCPLYLRGSTRVGCWPCIQANKSELAALHKDDRRIEAIERLEALVTDLRRQRREAKGDVLEHPMSLFLGKQKSANGRWEMWPIRRVLEWSQTQHGGSQMTLMSDWGREAGCVRWGMCEGVKP